MNDEQDRRVTLTLAPNEVNALVECLTSEMDTAGSVLTPAVQGIVLRRANGGSALDLDNIPESRPDDREDIEYLFTLATISRRLEAQMEVDGNEQDAGKRQEAVAARKNRRAGRKS